MLKMLCVLSVLVCQAFANGTAGELFRMTVLEAMNVHDYVRMMTEMEIENGSKDANIDEVLAEVKTRICDEAFFQKFASEYDNLTDDEIQWLIDIYKSDAMDKLEKIGNNVFPMFIEAMNESIQEVLEPFPTGMTTGNISNNLLDSILSITKEDFSKEVEDSEIPVVMDCYASWCYPCKKMSPILEELSAESMGQVKFVKFDIDTDPAFAQELKVRSVPTLLFFKGGELIGRHVGAISKDALETKVMEFVQ